MSDLLVVMNPRDIPECMDAIRELPIDKLWLRRMTEGEIADRWAEILEVAHGYDTLILQSDDGIPRPHALQAVRELLAAGHDVVTGYSNLGVDDMRVNLARWIKPDGPSEHAYGFYTFQEVQEWPDRVVPTALLGMALSGMSRQLWARFPFQVYSRPPGNASDYMVSVSLLLAGVKIVAAREGFVWHGKPVWGEQDRQERRALRLSEPSEIRLEKL